MLDIAAVAEALVFASQAGPDAAKVRQALVLRARDPLAVDADGLTVNVRAWP